MKHDLFSMWPRTGERTWRRLVSAWACCGSDAKIIAHCRWNLPASGRAHYAELDRQWSAGDEAPDVDEVPWVPSATIRGGHAELADPQPVLDGFAELIGR